MGNLIKMDWYKLRTSLFFNVMLIVTFVINLACAIAFPVITRMFMPNSAVQEIQFSSILAKPMALDILPILMLISLVSFSYSDNANGFIKNIAGQLPNKGYIVISKFVVSAIHNLIFMVALFISTTIGAFVTGKVVFDNDIPAGIATFFIKWLITLAFSAILLFITTGLRNKIFASILGVLLGSGFLSLVYLGLNTLFQYKIDINAYAPDMLFTQVNAITNVFILNAILVSVICIAVFIPLSYKIINMRDVK